MARQDVTLTDVLLYQLEQAEARDTVTTATEYTGALHDGTPIYTHVVTSNSTIPFGWLGWDGACRLHRTVGADGQRQHALDCPYVAAQYPAWRRAAVRAAGVRARMVTAAKSGGRKARSFCRQ